MPKNPIRNRFEGFEGSSSTPEKKKLASREKAREKIKKADPAIKKTNHVGGFKNITREQIEARSESKRKPNLKPSEIAEMEALWESGEVTLKELSVRFDRSQENISRHMTMNGVEKGAKAEEYSRLIKEKIALELTGDPGEQAKKIRQAKDYALGQIDLVKKLAANEIISAKKSNLNISTTLPALRALDQYLKVISGCRSEEYTLLGVKEFEERVEQEDIPELIVTELTGEEIESMRREQREFDRVMDDVDADINEIVDES